MKIKLNNSQMLPTFDYTITILNKQKAQDSATRQDVWFKTVIKNCSWSNSVIRSVTGNTVSVGASYICRIPKDIRYKPYVEWIKDNIGFTVSTGDYIIKGEIEEDIINPQTIQSIVRRHRPDAFEIKYFKDNTGTVELMEHYHVEGV